MTSTNNVEESIRNLVEAEINQALHNSMASMLEGRKKTIMERYGCSEDEWREYDQMEIEDDHKWRMENPNYCMRSFWEYPCCECCR